MRNRWIKFVREDSHFSRYYDGIFILFNTGLRISEFVGLTKVDVDFENMKINVDHQLQRYNGIGSARMNPKTLQYIIGHSDIGVTLNVYTHLGFDEASEEINRIAKEKKEQPAIKNEKFTKLKVV